MQEYQLTEADIKQLQEWGFEPDEINDADRIVYTYEDWLNPDRSMGLFPFGGWGIKAHYLTEKGDSTTKGNGKLTLFILPESEGQKIEQRKGEIVEGFVAAYFEALTSWFESQYEQSLEKKILTEKELKKVEKLLFEWNEDYHYNSYGEGFWLSFYNYASRKAGSMCDWYERFCVNGEDPKRAVSRHQATMTANELNSNHPEPLHYVVAALAFHRFKSYLKSKLEDKGALSSIQKAQIKQRYCCFDTDKIMEGLVRNYEVTQIEVRHFEDFFNSHPYTNLDWGNLYRDETTKDLDFEKLLTKIFDVSSLFNDEVQDYFFTCFLMDAEIQNTRRIGETDFYILKKRIEERRNVSKSTTKKKKKESKKEDALPDLESALVAPERLPALFEWLSKKQGEKEWFDKNGYIGTDERNASILLGFANGMRMARQIKPPITERQLYHVLCRHYNVKPTPEPHKARKVNNYDEVKILVMEFFRLK